MVFHVTSEIKIKRMLCGFSDILWPRTPFGEVANASCPAGSVGTATRACLGGGPKGGWAPRPDLSRCLHKEFVLFNQLLLKNNKTETESWVLAKKARDLVDGSRLGRRAGHTTRSDTLSAIFSVCHDRRSQIHLH